MKRRLRSKRKRLAIERQKEAGKALSRLKRKERPRVSKVFISTTQGRMECTSKEDIEWACITENRKRFSQTIDTPPMSKEVFDRVTDRYLKMVLEVMRKPVIVNTQGKLSSI